MRYQRIHSQMWADEKFRALSEQAKYLFIYILTSPHGNIIGIYVLPKQYIACDLEWSDKQLDKPFDELLASGLILYDEKSRLICIKNQIKHNPIENPKQARSAEKIVEALPKSSLFNEALKLLDKPYHKPLRELLAERITIPIADTEAVTGTETEEETELSPSKPVRVGGGGEDFEKFWSAYPRKKGKIAAQRAWAKLNGNRPDIEQVLAKLEQLKQSDDWTREGGRFIPHPATWINAGGWFDECQPAEHIPSFSDYEVDR